MWYITENKPIQGDLGVVMQISANIKVSKCTFQTMWIIQEWKFAYNTPRDIDITFIWVHADQDW